MWVTSSAEVGQGEALPSCFGSHTVNKRPFHGLFSAEFFMFLHLLLLMISVFQMAPSLVPKFRLED